MAAKTVIGFLATSPKFHSSRRVDAGDLDPGLHLAMAAASAHILAATKLLDDDLLVPELQKRGVYKTDYRQGTLREKLGGAGPRLQAPHPGAAYRNLQEGQIMRVTAG